MTSTAALLERIGTTQPSSEASRTRPAWRPEWTVNTFIVCNPIDADLGVFEIPEAEFVGAEWTGHMVVQVWKSNHRDFPAYRFTLGAITADGRFVPSVAPRVEGQRAGTPAIDYAVWDATVALLDAARRWQESDVAVAQDRYAERSAGRTALAKGPRGLGGPQSGKTERARAKGKAKPKQG